MRAGVASPGPQAIDPELVKFLGQQFRKLEMDTQVIFRK